MTRVSNATLLTLCSSCSSGRLSAVVAMFTTSVRQRRSSPFGYPTNAFQHCPEQAAQFFDFRLGKEIFAEQPDHLKRVALFGNLAAQIKPERSSRAHPQLEGKAANFDVGNRMVL